MGKPFRPPLPNRFFITLARSLLLPGFLRRTMRVEKVEVDPGDLERLKKLKGRRVVLCPNHPTGLDPVLLFHLSGLLEETFYFLAAREVFQRPLKGWFLQRLGCYSIVRGTADRDSFQMTRRILAEGKRWLVIFPEGETYGQNESLIPFQPGVVQLGFWALEDLEKRGERPPLYYVPVGLKYVYTHDMRAEISRALRRLEQRVGLSADAGSLYERLYRVGERVLRTSEKEMGIRPDPEASFDARVQNVKELVVSRVASSLGVKLRAADPLIDRIRMLLNTLDRILHEEAEDSEYEREAHRRRQEEVRPFYDDLRRILRFVAAHGSYVRETQSAERFLEIIGRLELEAFGKEEVRGPRHAFLKIGQPLELGSFLDACKKDRSSTLLSLTHELEEAIRSLIEDLVRTHPTVPVAVP